MGWVGKEATPKGILASENSESSGISNQEAIVNNVDVDAVFVMIDRLGIPKATTEKMGRVVLVVDTQRIKKK